MHPLSFAKHLSEILRDKDLRLDFLMKTESPRLLRDKTLKRYLLKDHELLKGFDYSDINKLRIEEGILKLDKQHDLFSNPLLLEIICSQEWQRKILSKLGTM